MTKDFTKADPAEGSREVIDHELARREGKGAKTGSHAVEAPLTKENILAAFADADDHLIAEMIALGANLNDLTEALAWLDDDDAAFEAGRAAPSGRAGTLLQRLREAEDKRVGGVTDEL
jgi:hypothetical protein